MNPRQVSLPKNVEVAYSKSGSEDRLVKGYFTNDPSSDGTTELKDSTLIPMNTSGGNSQNSSA